MLVALALLVIGGQVGWRTWYAPHGDYRAQVDAFFAGRLALSDAPEAMQHDLVWTGHDVQQVWGLGVPAWQAPFELVGRAIGVTPFPDRVALLAWLALVVYACVRAFWRRDDRLRGAGSTAIAALLPAFVTLLRGRLGVYEEAAAYSYGAAILLLAGCVRLAEAPTRARYLLLVVAAGLVGFVRPTAWCYGLATFVVASLLRRRAKDVALGAALFVAGGAALYATNARRFGDGFEFGHHINLQSLPGNLYATRFSYPFQRISLASAAEELAGALFDRPDRHVRTAYYAKHLHRGQADAPRWREYYFTVFDYGYLPLLVAGLVLGARAWRRRDGPEGREPRWLVAWGAIGAAPLVVFYLRAPFLSSRYLLDLAPAFVAWMLIAWRAAAAWRPRAASGVLAVAWIASVAFSRTAPRLGPASVGIDEASRAADAISHAVAHEHPLPPAYELSDPALPAYTDVLEDFERCTNADGAAIAADEAFVPGDTCLGGVRPPDEEQWTLWRTRVPDDDAPEELCEAVCRPARRDTLVAVESPAPSLYLDMFRWDLSTGAVPPATYAWISDPEFVEIDLAAGDPQHVQVAIGRTHLRLVSLADTPHGTRLRFEAPHLPHGLVVAFFAFGPDSELDRAVSGYRITRIAWR